VARRVRVLSEVVGVEWWATAAVVEARDTVAAASVVAVETVGVAGVAQVEGCTIRNSCTHSADNANYERAHHTMIRMLSSADRAHQRENIRGAVVQVGAAALAESTATGMMAPVRVAGPSGGKRALVEKAKAATAEVPVVAVVRTVTAVESGGAVVILALVVGGVAVVRWVAESVAAAASVADSVAAAASVATVVEAAAAAI